MAYSRFVAGCKKAGSLIKTGFSVARRSVLGSSIVAARGGTSVFNAFKFADYWAKYFKTDSINANSWPGLLAAMIGLIGALGTATTTRFFNLYRKESASKTKKPAETTTPAESKYDSSSAADSLSENLLQSNAPSDLGLKDLEVSTSQKPTDEKKEEKKPEALDKEATCCYPGVDTNSWNIGYKLSQLLAAMYGFGSGTSGILSAGNLIILMQKVFSFEYEGSCGDNESSAAKIVLENFLMLLLIYANVQSLRKYNVPALREYYRKLLLEARLFTPDGFLYSDDAELCDESGQPLNLHTSEGNLYDEEENLQVIWDQRLFTPETFAELKLKRGKLYTPDGLLYNEGNVCDQEGKPLNLESQRGKLFNKSENRELTSAEIKKLTESQKLYTADKRKYELFFKKGWREVGWLSYLEVFVGATLGSIGVFFSNQNLIGIFRSHTLCHLFPSIGEIHSTGAKIFSGIGALANFAVSAQMSTGANFNKQETERLEQKDTFAEAQNEANAPSKDAADIAEEKEEKQPEKAANRSPFGCFNAPILGCIYENAVNNGMGTFAACTNLPDSLAGRPDLTTTPLTIALSTAAAILNARNIYKLDMEGKIREENTRRKLQKAADELKAASNEPSSSSSSPTHSINNSNTNNHVIGIDPNANPSHDSALEDDIVTPLVPIEARNFSGKNRNPGKFQPAGGLGVGAHHHPIRAASNNADLEPVGDELIATTTKKGFQASN
ncbi:MAG: hypothetical protein ABI597_13695 [Gammaproteobacteria bacterium]